MCSKGGTLFPLNFCFAWLISLRLALFECCIQLVGIKRKITSYLTYVWIWCWLKTSEARLILKFKHIMKSILFVGQWAVDKVHHTGDGEVFLGRDIHRLHHLTRERSPSAAVDGRFSYMPSSAVELNGLATLGNKNNKIWRKITFKTKQKENVADHER